MLAPVYDASLESLRGACVRNPCAEGAVRVQGADGRLSACVPMDDLDCSLASLPLLAADGGVHVPLCADAKRHIIRVNSRPTRDSCPITDNKGACVAAVVRTPQPFDWGLEDEAEDSVAFPSDAAAADRSIRIEKEGKVLSKPGSDGTDKNSRKRLSVLTEWSVPYPVYMMNKQKWIKQITSSSTLNMHQI
ncbi:Protein of unknown function [Gryllus bimaculatus]|nr:Protein of unknown function [Gryllus bimaculatus]